MSFRRILFFIIIFDVLLPKDKFNPNDIFYPTIIGLSWKHNYILETIELFNFELLRF